TTDGAASSASSPSSSRHSDPAHDWMRGQSRQNSCNVASSSSSSASWVVRLSATSSNASIASRSCWAASAMVILPPGRGNRSYEVNPSGESADKEIDGTARPVVAGRPSRQDRHRALRLRGDRVETVVRVYEAPATGRRLHLVATMHLGEPAYYEALSGLLADLAAGGAAVHYERIRRADDTDVTPEERARLEEVESSGYPAGLDAFVAVLGLELQGERLALPAGARNVDASDVELLRGLGGEEYRRLVARPEVAFDERAAPLARPLFRFLLRHGAALDRFRALSARHRRVQRFMIGHRNRLALAEALAALGAGDVALVWGSAHLPGMGRQLERAGYRLRAEQWLTVCTL